MTSEPTASPPPDWATLAEDVRCPLCDYSLRGLAQPRCPECGYTFDWRDLTDISRRLHPYLFEHHPEKNVRSFFRTLIGGLRPRRFWSTLHPAQPSRPGRIALYFLLLSLVFFAVLQLALAGIFAQWLHLRLQAVRGSGAAVLAGQIQVPPEVIAPYGSLQALVNARAPATLTGAFVWDQFKGVFPRFWWTLQLPLVILAWPWGTFVSLLIFQQSMGRRSLRAGHVLRCAIYSFDAVLWAWLAAAAAAVALYRPWITTRNSDQVVVPLFWALLGTAVLAHLYRLIVAYRQYLKFDHAVATVLCSQLILWLAAFTAAVVVTVILNA